MKTTIDINEAILREAEAYAIRENRALDSVVEEALREKVAAGKPPSTAKPYRMEVSKAGGGPLPGVNLDKTSELLEL